MLTFIEWLLAEEKHVPPSVLRAYDNALQEELKRLIGRTKDPALRKQFEDMLECPVRDSRGNCHAFADYVLSALIRQGLHTRYDIEAVLGYIFEKLLLPHKDTGEPRATVFGSFQERPDYAPGTNPLQARFLAFLGNALRNIRQGKVPRLANVEHRPQGTVSIGLGRGQEGDPAGISPEQIAAPPSGDADLGEMVQDIEALLKKKERAYGFPLVNLFRAIMRGMTVEQQRKRFGDRRVRPARQVIMQTVEDYARSTQNFQLLRLLGRMREPAGQSPPPSPAQPQAPKPVLSEKERDYASILAVLDRLGRPAGSADLGKYRRRWLDYPPRNPLAGYRNRLEEVLANMAREGVIVARTTRSGAVQYVPGPAAASYRKAAS